MTTTTNTIGNYAIVREIAQGGFGRTLLAENPEGKRVVLKQENPQQYNLGSQALRLFDQECDRLKEVGDHDQIPSFIEYFEEGGCRYIAQEFVEGQTLKNELKECGTYSEGQIVALLQDILPVIQFVHGKQVIHRDIKPENIIRRSTDGKLVLVDFGASKPVSETVLAKTGTMIGSPLFVAPEQSRGKARYASDIYSLGLTCAHLLTNVSPFDLVDEDDGKWVWQDYCTQAISNDLAQIINTMLSRGLRDRYKSASEVLAALAALEKEGESGLLDTESINPWKQQDDEADEWFNRFEIFLHMTSEARDVSTAYYRRDKADSECSLEEWINHSTRFSWVARANAYDAYKEGEPIPYPEQSGPLSRLKRPVVVFTLTAMATTGIAVWRNAPFIWKESPSPVVIEQPSPEPSGDGGFLPRFPIIDDLKDDLVADMGASKELAQDINHMFSTIKIMLVLIVGAGGLGLVVKNLLMFHRN